MQKLPNNEIDKIDEALRLLWLDAGQNASLDNSRRELSVILSAPVMKEMPIEKKEKMVNDLLTTLYTISFGELITAKIKAQSLNEQKLAAETRLDAKRIEDLKSDMVYPNSVPVVLLTTLLKNLSISYHAAERAILKTFEIVHKRALLVPYFTPNLAFRRDQDVGIRTRNSSRNSSRKELYENKEALLNYLTKLEELMT